MNLGPIVQLRFATLPGTLGLIAVHYWFAIDRHGQWTRWEVWQDANAGGTSKGHVHRDLMPIDQGVGGGPMRIAYEWTDAKAHALVAVLEQAFAYPAHDRYRAWPGPNSNTFARWVLDRAGVRCQLDPRAIGKDWRGWLGVRRPPDEFALGFDVPFLGARLGIARIELHLLGQTCGLSLNPPRIDTPIGAVPS